MAKKKEETSPKPRAKKYEEKVTFDGTLEQMVKIAGSTKIVVDKKREKN